MPPDSKQTIEEKFFDDYLDAALRGEHIDPAAFCREHPEAAPKLQEWVANLERLLDDHHGKATKTSTSTEPSTLPVEAGLPYESLGDFRLLRRLGEGGMGVVFLAEETRLRRLVALKLIRFDMLGSPTAAARLEREAQAAARLRHPGIAAVLRYGEDRGICYIAMELVPGKSLEDIYSDEGKKNTLLHVQRLISIGRDIARALACAHEAGIVHRDVKPSNIKITPQGRAVLLDFGLAREMESSAPTLTHSFVGSPAYAPPEQVDGRSNDIGPASDIYSLGATLYEGLTGRPPFDAATTQGLMRKILVDDPAPPRKLNPSIPQDLATVVLKALEKEPAKRYKSANEFAEDLDAVLEYRAIRAKPPHLPRRIAQWARRNRVAAGSIVAVVAIATVAVASILIQSAERRAGERKQAAQNLASARSLLKKHDEARTHASASAWAERRLRSQRQNRWLTPEEDSKLATLEAEIAQFRRNAESRFAEVTTLLTEATRLDPELNETRDAWAEFYYQKWLEARTAQDPALSELYRDLVIRNDLRGEWKKRVAGHTQSSFQLSPAEAELHLFRVVDLSDLKAGAENRLVYSPIHVKQKNVNIGEPALRVVSGAGNIKSGDHILAIEQKRIRGVAEEENSSGTHISATQARELAERGGTLATVWTNGSAKELELPPGLQVRATAAPLLYCEESRLEGTDRETLLLDAGAYLAFARCEGYEDQRFAFHADHNTDPYAKDHKLSISLLPQGTSPPGFVYISVMGFGTPEEGAYWIAERETTCAEYLEFINDPATKADVDAGRSVYRVPDKLAPDAPVLGVSFQDAQAYANWRNARHPQVQVQFALPNYIEWARAAQGGDGRTYPFGNSFSPKWLKSKFSRQQPGVEPVMTYFTDESAFGVFDLGGSAAEWCAGLNAKGKNHVTVVAGGAWDLADEPQFYLAVPRQLPPDTVSESLGFRLVARKKKDNK